MVFTDKKALLLDMNGTFMFDEDRFGDAEDFSLHYAKLGGTRSRTEVNHLVRAAYAYLDVRYPDPNFRHCFPSLEHAIRNVAGDRLNSDELATIIDTFAFHELGTVPREYAAALHSLSQRFVLAAVIDIWAPKSAWLTAFERAGVGSLFSALSFSSDHGMVKPSAKPFELVLNQLGVLKAEALVIGDSTRRDLGGARNAGIDCVLVGDAEHPDACAHFATLLEFCESLRPPSGANEPAQCTTAFMHGAGA